MQRTLRSRNSVRDGPISGSPRPSRVSMNAAVSLGSAARPQLRSPVLRPAARANWSSPGISRREQPSNTTTAASRLSSMNRPITVCSVGGSASSTYRLSPAAVIKFSRSFTRRSPVGRYAWGDRPAASNAASLQTSAANSTTVGDADRAWSTDRGGSALVGRRLWHSHLRRFIPCRRFHEHPCRIGRVRRGAVNQSLKSAVREIRMRRSVGAGGGRPPPATR